MVNPIRYRGYYVDEETGFYYLQSRYYDTKTGRYVNPDGYVFTGQDMQSGNMYAYCGNNPVTRSDPYGGMYVIDGGDGSGIHGKSQSDWDRWGQKIEARKKYNANTVNIYSDPQQYRSGAVNVYINANNMGSDNQPDPNIHIENSYQIRNKIEMETIIDLIMSDSAFDSTIFTRDKESYMIEWTGHNKIYDLAVVIQYTSWIERAKHVDLNEKESHMAIWRFLSLEVPPNVKFVP